MPKAILLADDSLTIQKVVELTFSDTSYELTAVSNGVEALEALKRSRPDLVIADVVMPGKNGYEVCEAVKSDPATASIPVILLSGTFEPFDRDRAEKARADAIVTKPFDSKNLLSQVEALLASAAPTAALEVAHAPAPEEPSYMTQAFPSGIPPAPEAAMVPEMPAVAPPPEDEMHFESPEPVAADIESAIAEYERRESGMIDTGGLEEPVAFPEPPAPEEPAPAPKAPSVSPISRPVEVAPVEPLDFTLDDTSPFREPAKSEPAAPIEEVAVFSGEDNVFDFPGGPAAEVPAPSAAEPEPVFGGEDLFAAAPPPAAPPAPAPLAEPAAPAPARAAAPGAPEGEVSPDIERLAQSASISDLASMVHRVAPSAALSEEDVERITRRVIEHLSDKVIREIAWDVVPDMAEMVVRKRIEELEAEAPPESE